MAVEARHRMNFFPSQIFSNKEFIKSLNPSVYASPNSIVFPSPNGLLLANESISPLDGLLPVFPSLVSDYTVVPGNKMSMNNKAESGLTCNVQPVAASPSRKRPRDFSPSLEDGYVSTLSKCAKLGYDASPLVDADVVFQINQQQSEIDRYIADHTQRVRLELEERRKRHSRVFAEAVQECIMRRMRERDDELNRLGKLNWALQERVKALYVENQLWRDLAQTNEATANSLRSNLEQVLAHVGEDRNASPCVAVPDEDAESSCGSSQPCGGESRVAPDVSSKEKKSAEGQGFRTCRKCGNGESSVLLLPCRHLCLCTKCGSSSAGVCPVCGSFPGASVHVNMS